MRKQYHFRNIYNNIHIWDVDNIILLTKDLEEEEIPLSSIKELDETYWYDIDNSPTCRSVAEHMILVQEADLKYPIIICPEGKIIDGMHRVVKAYLNNQKSIFSYRLKKMPKPDFININPEELPYD
ncbi:MAG TPA: hypothetical protein K8U92_08240 [Aliarcobacter thereius]|uniref:hypothetical protein n=1 Tax=Aliarcobacter thereius TaxID=544718 RepID=UPI0010FF2A4D|nr:hypothetical protein [Aliarcobacter thereius]TLT05774.1 hypothetical protein FE243_09330 [Aliarcobacter thereius]HJE03850.1 hypothetical protein [Aliarcobacter thereius]